MSGVTCAMKLESDCYFVGQNNQICLEQES